MVQGDLFIFTVHSAPAPPWCLWTSLSAEIQSSESLSPHSGMHPLMAFGQAAFDHGWTKGMGPGRADLEDEKEQGSSSF